MKKIHFIGIGGIGMSALAQYFHDRGVVVTGSDRSASPVTELLESKGIRIVIGSQKAANVPTDAGMVVYSDAVPEDNPERARACELGIPELSYFKMLGLITLGKASSAKGSGGPRRTVAVAGTHGKTTTTGMLAKILKDAGASPTAIIGSLVKDFGSNYLHGDSDLFVVEACEYRDHLLELSPEILVITNLEWDHTDWFPSLQVLQDTFRRAIEKVPANGMIITNPHDENIAPLLRPSSAKGYSRAQQGYAGQARVVDYTKEPVYELRLPGEFNVMNARAAAAAARAVLARMTPGVQHQVLMHDSQHLVLNTEQIAESLASFHGTWRRFEYKGKTKNGAEVYDDYAHHPTAVKKTLEALRVKTKGKIYVAFHPHLYSRTRDLFNEFANAFTDAGEVFIAPIYAARETDDGAVSSAMLAEQIQKNGTNAYAATFTEIEQVLRSGPGAGDAVMTMGAGDIYKVADALVARGT